MRKITKESVQAFDYGRNFKKGNMQIVKFQDRVEMRLHGNLIAKKVYGVGTFISNCGWESNTTKERLNGLLENFGKYIYQKNYVWYMYDRKTDSTIEFPSGQFVKIG